VRFAQAEGYMQVTGNRALLLVEEAHPPGDLDAADLRERLQAAERELESAGEDTEKRRFAERDKARLETFIAIAEG
jgi:F-type H+-transporting ATPase subunit epsilon